jgi:hypothetical protein
MDFRNLLLAGVWLGCVKPAVNSILQPVLDKLYSLSTEGVQLKTPNGPKTLKARLLACVFDLPAKAMSLNFTQWNGAYGCNCCLDVGVHESHRRLYLPNAEHKIRCEKDVMRYAGEAVCKNRPVYGVKGNSVLTPHLNIVKDIPIDYMHAVLEGVTKTLLCKMWMDGRHSNLLFYLARNTKEIDSLLLAIKPPHEFRRSPRCIGTVKYWKASELRAFLLCYAISVLMEFLPADYIHHLSLLVKSIHILLSGTIHSADLRHAKCMLSTFYRTAPLLYPNELCTMNVHSLIHLCDSVQRCGPLWAISCFGFESMNGDLKRHCHGTRNVLPQLVRNVRFHQTISRQKKSKSSDGIRGRIVHKPLKSKYISALEARDLPISNTTLPVFPRYKLKGVVYHVWSEKRLRNSSTCRFLGVDGLILYGSIRCFCLCDKKPIAIIATFLSVRDTIDSLRAASTVQELNDYSMVNPCIYSAEKLSTSWDIQAVPISSIMVKCVHVPSQLCDYIIPLPNTYEHH